MGGICAHVITYCINTGGINGEVSDSGGKGEEVGRWESRERWREDRRRTVDGNGATG
jgi:hypothetical protein